MKDKKLMIICSSIFGIIFIIVAVVYIITCIHRNRPEAIAIESAKTALFSVASRPDSIKILSILKPDSVFGREYASDEEKVELTLLLLQSNDSLLKQTKDFDSYDPDDDRLNDIMERNMETSTSIRNLLKNNLGSLTNPQKRTFTGFRVKIEVTGISEFGNRFHSQYWFITDKTGKHVVNTFEIPVL